MHPWRQKHSADDTVCSTFLAPGVNPAQGVFIEAFVTSGLCLAVLMLAAEKVQLYLQARRYRSNDANSIAHRHTIRSSGYWFDAVRWSSVSQLWTRLRQFIACILSDAVIRSSSDSPCTTLGQASIPPGLSAQQP